MLVSANTTNRCEICFQIKLTDIIETFYLKPYCKFNRVLLLQYVECLHKKNPKQIPQKNLGWEHLVHNMFRLLSDFFF